MPIYKKSMSINFKNLFTDGILQETPENFDVDFTYENLEARIHQFVSDRYDNLSSFVKYVLAHFPYTSYDLTKGANGWSAGPGFMFRIKRHIKPNLNSHTPNDLYEIQDSLELFVSFSFGVSRKYGPANVSLGVGPAYVKKYYFTSYAASKSEAQKSTWTLTKEMLLGVSVSSLHPLESLTVESGYLANASLSANLRAGDQSYVRPQAYLMANYQWLTRSYAYIESAENALVGFGRSEGYELTSQAMIRAITKMARVPFFAWSKRWMNQEGGVYRVPLALLKDDGNPTLMEAFSRRDSSVYENRFPKAQYQATYRLDSFFLGLGFFSTKNNKWNGFVELAPAEGPSPLLPQKRKFYLVESSSDDSRSLKISYQPNTRS